MAPRANFHGPERGFPLLTSSAQLTSVLLGGNIVTHNYTQKNHAKYDGIIFTQKITQFREVNLTPYYMDLGQAKVILRPRVPAFAGSLRKALHEWNKELGAYHAIVDEFARGVMISQFWYAYSSEALRGDLGISREKHGNRPYYIVDDKLVLRFKRVDDAYRSWNHPTSRARAWDAQASFSTMPPMAKLELGYRLDVTGTVVMDAAVILNYKGRSLWRWQIWGRRVSEFAAAPRDAFGREVYSYEDFSEAVLP